EVRSARGSRSGERCDHEGQRNGSAPRQAASEPVGMTRGRFHGGPHWSVAVRKAPPLFHVIRSPRSLSDEASMVALSSRMAPPRDDDAGGVYEDPRRRRLPVANAQP